MVNPILTTRWWQKRFHVRGRAAARETCAVQRCTITDFLELKFSSAMAYFDSYHPGTKIPFSGIYRVFHGLGHAEPHCVTLRADRQFPQCSKCAGFVRFELIFDAPYVEDNEFFRSLRDE